MTDAPAVALAPVRADGVEEQPVGITHSKNSIFYYLPAFYVQNLEFGKHRAAERWKIIWNNDTNRLFFVSSDRNEVKKNIWQNRCQMGIFSIF